ncbi:MAG: hypothetical protein QM736_11625 [Vicinamibacterales bacterium]
MSAHYDHARAFGTKVARFGGDCRGKRRHAQPPHVERQRRAQRPVRHQPDDPYFTPAASTIVDAWTFRQSTRSPV